MCYSGISSSKLAKWTRWQVFKGDFEGWCIVGELVRRKNSNYTCGSKGSFQDRIRRLVLAAQKHVAIRTVVKYSRAKGHGESIINVHQIVLILGHFRMDNVCSRGTFHHIQ